MQLLFENILSIFSEIIKYTVMKKFKQIDFWISVGLILGSVIYGAKENLNFFAGYFIVGGWQVISMLIHFFNKWFCERGSKRYNYHRTVVVILLCTALGFVVYPLLMLVCFTLLFIAPVMAIYYTWICYNEIHVKMQRPLALLK